MHQTLEAFSDRSAFSDNALTRLDARVKLVLALAAILTVLVAHKLAVPLTVFAACLTAMWMLPIPRRVLLVRAAGPVCVAGVLFVLKTLFSGPARGGPMGGEADTLWRISLGGWTISVARSALSEGAMMAGRVLGSTSVLVLLGSVTPAFKVFAALRWARMPRTMVELAMLMYRCIFGLLDQVIQVRAAQRVRLGYVGAVRSLRSTGSLMGTVILRSLDQADRTHEAMLVRQYDGTLPMGELGPLGRGQLLILAAGLAVLGAGMGLCWGGLL
jgi:cobalt/nickel transport system permease protein